MPVIQLEDDKAYGDVLYQLLYKIGGTFHARDDRVLILSGWQLKALQEAGVLPANDEQRKAKRGKKKK